MLSGYKMKREAPIQDGERLDTIDQGDDDDDDYKAPDDFDYNDDQEGELEQEDDVDSDEGRMKRQGAERIEVNLDDVNDDDDNEGLLPKGGAGGPPGLFTIKESQDRGLADMETGSEVYMSELLVSWPYSLLKFLCY